MNDTTNAARYHEYMHLALMEAQKAAQADEVPVGAVLVDSDGTPLAADHNRTILLSDPTAHAEIGVLRRAGQRTGNYRLLNTTLYVTVEPCPMCMGAIIHARVARVVFGAHDPKWGAAGSLYDLARDGHLNHRPEIVSGICESDCRDIIKKFFKQKRDKKE